MLAMALKSNMWQQGSLTFRVAWQVTDTRLCGGASGFACRSVVVALHLSATAPASFCVGFEAHIR
jgi:hypothetical protein